MLQIGVQNGTPNNILWDWSEPLTVRQLLERMEYLLNAGSWREDHLWPNAIKIRQV